MRVSNLGWVGLIAVSIVFSALFVATAKEEGDKKGTNQAAKDSKEPAKANEAAKGVEQLALGNQLATYGREAKSPTALLTAAEIISKVSTTELDAKPKSTTDKDAPKAKEKSSPKADNSPKALVAEAKKLGGDNPGIAAFARSIEATLDDSTRGAIPGPKIGAYAVAPYSTDQFVIPYRGGELAELAVSGDRDTRLDVYVYDENGNLITSAVGPGDQCLCRWLPKWSGPFSIHVANRGGVSNRYGIATN